MKLQLNKTVIFSFFFILLIPFSQASARSSFFGQGSYNISFQNVSPVIFSPPVIALCPYKIPPIAEIGKQASVALEELAEDGATAGLVEIFTSHNCNYHVFNGPVTPGQTVTATLSGHKYDYLYTASMLLPTNDAFVALSGKRVYQILWKGHIKLSAYDAGTESNDELCASIPTGGGCAGEGFNPSRNDKNFISAHPGIIGGADLNPSSYRWNDPVAILKINN